MDIRSLCWTALCVVCATHSCFAAVVYSQNGQLDEKENVDKIVNSDIGDEILIPTTNQPDPITPDKEIVTKSSSSSEESNSKEGKLNKSSSESNEDSSSEEQFHRRIKRKRSLDSKQGLQNAIGVNQTKDNNGLLEANEHKTHNSSTFQAENELEAANPTTIEQHSESTTPKIESETTTHISETTEIEAETTTETEAETGTTDVETTLTETETTTASSAEVSSIGNTESSEDETSSSSTTSSTPPNSGPPDEKEESLLDEAMDKVYKLSDQIRLVLMNYRKKGVVVLPGKSFFPDPMPMQDFQKSFSVGTVNFKSMNVYGLSNFTVEHVNTDVDRMQVYILLHMKRLVILGNYTLRTFFSRAAGPFNVTLLGVNSEGVAEIETTADGHLEATDSDMDMFTSDMKVDFKNLGFMGSMFQGMVEAVGDALFDNIKPKILERVNLVIRNDVNKKLKDFSVKFINKISPVDLAFSEGRRYARENGYDPYRIKDHSFIVGGLVHVNITQFEVEGLSKFYRVGNLSLSMDAGVVEIGVHVMTKKLTGHCHWSGATFGIMKSGRTNFTVDHLQVKALVTQSLDIRKKPQLKDLDLELGWVKVTMDNPMTLNLMIEGIINAFPRLIRHIIVDTLETPLREKIQEILDKINVESIVDSNLPRLDSFGL